MMSAIDALECGFDGVIVQNVGDLIEGLARGRLGGGITPLPRRPPSVTSECAEGRNIALDQCHRSLTRIILWAYYRANGIDLGEA